MNVGTAICGILMFAAVTAALYVWGLRKSMAQQSDLTRYLMNACGSRVVRYLKKHPTITAAQVAKEIEGVKAGQFWSRNRLQVENGKKVSGQVIDFLLDQQYIEPAGRDTYRLKK